MRLLRRWRPASFAAVAAVLLAASIRADGTAPVNAACPVDGNAVQAALTAGHDGHTIGFCSEKCRETFAADPAAFAAKIPELKKAAPAPDSSDQKPPEKDSGNGTPGADKAPDFSLKDTDGKKVSLADFKGKIVVLQWINPECPYCLRVTSTGLVGAMIKELQAISKDVVFLPVSSTPTIGPKRIAAYLKDCEVPIKALMDRDGTVGKAYGAKTTPHVFVIDGEGILRYRGAFDDDPKGKGGEGRINYVVEAVRQIAAGKEVSQAETKPYG